MELPRRPRNTPRESITPMINVVFLLLIFFLLTAQIAPPEPFEVDPPESLSETPADGQDILYVNAGGDLAFGAARGDQVFAAIEQLGADGALMIRADQAVPAANVANLLGQLAQLGLGQVKLIAERR